MLHLSFLSPRVGQIGIMLRQPCWYPVVILLACLFQNWCSWSCRLCDSLNPYPNPNPNETLVLQMSFQSPWVAIVRKVQRQPCWCPEITPFFQPQYPRDCGTSGSLNPNHKDILVLCPRYTSLLLLLFGKGWRQQYYVQHDPLGMRNPALVSGTVASVSLGTLTLTELFYNVISPSAQVRYLHTTDITTTWK